MPLFIALGDEIRLTIVEALTDEAYRRCNGDFSAENISRHGLNVREITEQTSLSRPAVSHHLKILKNAGLISMRREGTCNYYYLSIADSTSELMNLGQRLRNIFHFEME
ncbi:MAG: ArsR family transcriptional regulator [Clostridiaceae bacterium]|nr:ArsR family transcriptional regulator [Clostridiaceae bacterium]